MTTKQDIVRRILDGRATQMNDRGAAYAPSNIALCKYWGKRDEELNLPLTSSLSVSMGPLGTYTEISVGAGIDRIVLNDQECGLDTGFAKRLIEYLDLYRTTPDTRFNVTTKSTIPIAAGLASSASGFAALVLALDDLFGWELERKQLSILARLGSGSASRSVYTGFVEWHAGAQADGMDSYAERFAIDWPGFCMGLLTVSEKEKHIGSRPAMKRTRDTSALYAEWPAKVANDLLDIKRALRERDFTLLGRAAESNALAMHGTMIAAWPPVLYWLPESVALMRSVWDLREKGLDAYFTMDAGPNLKLIFLEKDSSLLCEAFPTLRIIKPFSAPGPSTAPRAENEAGR